MIDDEAALQDHETARSFLFVPGDRPERFDKAVASGAGIVILDLEDAVAPENKAAALDNVVAWLRGGERAVVRINPIDSPTHDAEAAALRLLRPCLMIPKVTAAAQLERFAGRTWPEGAPIIPLIETAEGVFHALQIARVPGVSRLAFGSIDLAAELGIDPRNHQALAHGRSALVYASAAAGLAAPIDGVTTQLKDQGILLEDLQLALTMGMGAKMCLHPQQVGPTNEAFAPRQTEVEWARRVLDVASITAGVVAIDGEMIDAPVVARAERIVARARRPE